MCREVSSANGELEPELGSLPANPHERENAKIPMPNGREAMRRIWEEAKE